MKFRTYLNEQFVIESFDTSLNISKFEKGNPDLYYVNIHPNEFRIFVEKSEDNYKDLHIGFEYNHPKKGRTIEDIYDTLEAKEILGLFGTILKILKSYEINTLMFCTKEKRKFRTYLRMMGRLSTEFKFESTSHNDVCIFCFNSEYQPKIKFNYKGKYNEI